MLKFLQRERVENLDLALKSPQEIHIISHNFMSDKRQNK